MCGPTSANPCTSAFGAMGVSLPSDSSFVPFFRKWFDECHFPKMSSELQKELHVRAESRGVLQGLTSQVRGWAMANMDKSLQADVWYLYICKRARPVYGNFCVARTATVNIGSMNVPCNVSFWGLPKAADHWMISPFAGCYVDYGALLDEVDAKGGFQALIAAAA